MKHRRGSWWARLELLPCHYILLGWEWAVWGVCPAPGTKPTIGLDKFIFLPLNCCREGHQHGKVSPHCKFLVLLKKWAMWSRWVGLSDRHRHFASPFPVKSVSALLSSQMYFLEILGKWAAGRGDGNDLTIGKVMTWHHLTLPPLTGGRQGFMSKFRL